MRWNRKKIARAVLLAGLGLGVIFILYLTLLCHPGLFFPHAFTRGGITVYSDEPIPPDAAGRILEEVERRLTRSPLAESQQLRDLRVYICNRRWRFVLFANYRYRVAGLAYAPLTDNVFLRAARFDTNRLIGPSGREVPGERTLDYYLAHELVHVLVARELGIVEHWRLPAWKNEGYADLIAKGGDFDFERVRGQFRRGDRELDPKRSGLYLRYHLLVAYLLQHRGVGAHELLKGEFDRARLEREILAIEDGETP